MMCAASGYWDRRLAQPTRNHGRKIGSAPGWIATRLQFVF